MAVRAKSAATGRNREAAAPARRKAAARPKRDPEAMQRRILDAATAEFASHGYGGARVERISASAGTVDRMLYYYFGSKEGLFRAVLEGVYERLGEAEQQLHLTETDPVKGMRELVAFTWNYYLDNPDFIRLLNTENLHGGQHVKKSKRVKALSFPVLSIVTDLLARGAAQRKFRRGVDPIQIYVTIAALGYFYLANRYTLSRFLGVDLMTAPRRKAGLAHITDVVLTHISVR